MDTSCFISLKTLYCSLSNWRLSPVVCIPMISCTWIIALSWWSHWAHSTIGSTHSVQQLYVCCGYNPNSAIGLLQWNPHSSKSKISFISSNDNVLISCSAPADIWWAAQIHHHKEKNIFMYHNDTFGLFLRRVAKENTEYSVKVEFQISNE